jgi:hypothetical protein
MKTKLFVWGKYIALIIILLVMSFFAGRVLANPTATGIAQTNTQLSEPNISNEPNASDFFCPTINNVAAFSTRVHIRCSAVNGDIAYYAYANDPTHSIVANQILAVANTAFALGSGVWVYYNDDQNLNPPGCNVGDCRGLVGISIVP